MPATIVLGGQWGDEGKGKLTDALAQHAKMVVRANGGSNAGHTVTTDSGVFKLHLIPSGILNPACIPVIGAGVVIDPFALVAEVESLEARGVSTEALVISDRAHLVLPWHSAIDRAQESSRGSSPIGTTLRGIGPAYADKASRSGLRIADLFHESRLREKIFADAENRNRILATLGDELSIDADQLFSQLAEVAARLRRHVGSSELIVQDLLDSGGEVIVECAQGAMLDVDYGTYPFVTSSSPTAAGACQGAGVAPSQVARVVAVYKAYSTRVGSGSLPTELLDETGDEIRRRGNEFGTTTGRPRRIGWFDAVSGRFSSRLNGTTEIALTLVDVLDTFPVINVCTSYDLNGVPIDHLPARSDLTERVQANYTTRPGWLSKTSDIREYEALPKAATDYVTFLQQCLGAPISMIGVGPSRDQLIPVNSSAAILQMASAARA